MLQISDDIVNMLQADRQPDIALRDTGGELLLRTELGMGCRRRVNGKAAGIADIGDVIKELQRVDEPLACRSSALQFEADQTAKPTRQVSMRVVQRPASLRRWMNDLGNIVVLLSGVLAFANLVFTAVTLHLGPAYYGYGYAGALLLTVLAGAWLLDRKLDTLEYETFMLQ